MTLQDTTALNGEVIPPGGEDVRVVAAHHPFKVERTDQQMLAGLTLAEMLERAQPDPVLRRHARIMLGDWEVPREHWHRVRPKPGTTVTIRVVPHGGGGGDKNPLRTVLSIAVIAAAAFVSGGGLGAVFASSGEAFAILGTTGAAIAGAGIAVAGSLAINALIPPSQPSLPDLSGQSTQDSPSLSIRGGRNRANKFGAVPRPLGKHRMYPPLAADYVTEVNGDDQYLRMAVCWGYGPLLIENLRIGETLIEEFSDVQVETDPGFSKLTSLPFFPATVDEQQLSIALKQSEGFTTRTTEPDADEIVVDITFPRGLVEFNDRGNKQSRTVEVEAQYAPTGTNDWKGVGQTKSVGSQNLAIIQGNRYYSIPTLLPRYVTGVVYVNEFSGEAKLEKRENFVEPPEGNPINWIPKNALAVATFQIKISFLEGGVSGSLADVRDLGGKATGFAPSLSVGSDSTPTTVSLASGTVDPATFRIVGRQTNALRRSVRFDVPRGQYDVRLRRVTADTNDNQVFDDVAWTALRTITNEPPITFEQPIAVTALRIRATDQLNGVIDQLNADVTAILPDWDGSSWVQRPAVNPASAFRDVLTGNANARALATSRLDDTTLQEWHDFCEDNGFAYNFPGDTQTSVQRKLADIAQAGRAAPTIRDGKWSVVIDQERTTPVQHFTPRNSWGFEGQKAFPEQPHAFRIRFPNENEGYEQDERIVYDDGYDEDNATKFEGLELAGVTAPEQAYKLGRYHIATARLRPEVYTFSADVEHIVCTRGDLIRVTHDVPLWGLNSGRVVSVTDDGGSPAQATGVRLDEEVTMEAGKSYNLRFRLANGDTLVKDVDTVAGDTQDLTFSTPFDLADAPEVGDLAMFGEVGSESVELVVKSIEPGENLTAKITAVDHSPAIYQADQGTIPAFESQITPIEEIPTVNIIELRTDESALSYTATQGLVPRIMVSVQPWDESRAFIEAEIRESGEGENWRPAVVDARRRGEIVLSDVDQGEEYDIRLRWRREGFDLLSGPWTPRYSVRVKGSSSTPEPVTGLTVQAVSSLAVLRWDQHPDLDVRQGGRIRFRHSQAQSGATWQTSVSIGEAVAGNVSEAVLPLKSGTYLARAVDSGGRKGPVASVVTAGGKVQPFANVDTVQAHPNFSGTDSGTTTDEQRNPPALQLTSQGTIGDVTLMSEIDSFAALSGVQSSGTYTFASGIDVGSVQNIRLESTLKAIIVNQRDTIASRTENIGTWESITGNDDASADARMFVRATDDDPFGSPAWTAWERLDVGEYEARGFQFQLRLTTSDPAFNVLVEEASVSADQVA
jgi:hypothetical protein